VMSPDGQQSDTTTCSAKHVYGNIMNYTPVTLPSASSIA
jgi:hypothetical protein